MTYNTPDLHDCLVERRIVSHQPQNQDRTNDQSYSTRILPTVVERRCRMNVSGVVTPSPVGVAMLKLRYPSPPLPRPAMLGPFWMYRLVSSSRPMRVMASTL